MQCVSDVFQALGAGAPFFDSPGKIKNPVQSIFISEYWFFFSKKMVCYPIWLVVYGITPKNFVYCKFEVFTSWIILGSLVNFS